MARRDDRTGPFALTLALGLASAGCAGGPVASVPSSSSLRLSQSGAFSQSLNLTADDAIVTLGRLDATHVVASAKSGKAFDLDLDAGTVTAVDPWFQFDASSTSVFTVSKDYTWVLYVDDGMIGRNASPPDANHKFDISKVPVDDLIKSAAKLSPLAATPQQAFFITKDSLVVFTFNSNSVNRKKLPLPGGALAPHEQALGAGSIDAPAKNYGVWLATNQRLMRYLEATGAWTYEALVIKASDRPPSLLSLMLTGDAGAKTAGTVGLFGDSTITSLDRPAPTGSATSTGAGAATRSATGGD